MKALAKSAAARYQDCAEMIAELNRIRRDLDRETARLLEGAQWQLEVIESLATQRLASCDLLGVAAPADDGARIRNLLRERFPDLNDWLDGAPMTNAPSANSRPLKRQRDENGTSARTATAVSGYASASASIVPFRLWLLAAYRPSTSASDFSVTPGQPANDHVKALVPILEKLNLDFNRYINVHTSAPQTKADVWKSVGK